MTINVTAEAESNNVWYSYSGSDTVLIFVHGIFSNSRSCWMYTESKKEPVYWPSLIAHDKRFAGVDIYLAGFETDVDSTNYDLLDCANEVYDYLGDIRGDAREPVMAHKNLIFVGHSTGGIVARYVLTSNERAFQEKNVGIVLMASPSVGSVYADHFDLLTRIYKNELGGLLKKDSILLGALHRQFKEMVDKKKSHIPNLLGAEACEHHMVYRKKIFGRNYKWIPRFFGKSLIVDPESAASYFGARKIPNTDHFSIVKPPAATHASHDFLYRFYCRFQKEFAAGSERERKPISPDMAPLAAEGVPIGREGKRSAAKQRLLNGGDCAMWGPEGAGKTFIAGNLAQEADVRAAFPDGIIWGSLGKEEDLSALFGTWADALGIPRASIAQLRRVDDRAMSVAKEIGTRQMLIVCEDCETVEAAVMVRMIGTNCKRLITTRSQDVAKMFATEAGTIEIPPLTETEACGLFRTVAPALAVSDIAKIVPRLGGNAGEIMLIGRALSGIKDPARRNDLVRRLSSEAA